ncbi:MAG: hypothetical protein R6U08_04895 [Bacillota bacterium]
MRKILLGIVITGFALIVFFTVKPQTANLFVGSEAPLTGPAEESIMLEPYPYFTVVQGESAPALLVCNDSGEKISFSLGHEHACLTFQPQGDQLQPGSEREILLLVDVSCPSGEIELPVYLRANVNGERIGLETVVSFLINAGELTMEQTEGAFQVLWNGEQAPRGVRVYFRQPGADDWLLWGETPRINPPRSLAPGNYSFEFQARLDDALSKIYLFNVEVPEIIVPEEPEPEDENSASNEQASPQPEPEPAPPPEPPKPGTMEYLVWQKKLQEEALKKKQAPAEEEEDGWWSF